MERKHTRLYRVDINRVLSGGGGGGGSLPLEAVPHSFEKKNAERGFSGGSERAEREKGVKIKNFRKKGI